MFLNDVLNLLYIRAFGTLRYHHMLSCTKPGLYESLIS